MRIEKIDHVCFNVRNLDEATRFFADLLGTEFSSVVPWPELDMTSAVEPMGLEVVAPLTPDGPTAKAIKRRGEGVALVAFKVDNLEEGIADFQARGIRLVRRADRSRMKLAMFHPKDTYGVMLELIEYKSEHPTAPLRE
ncbi:MAG: VOC family protein [Chloroflexi bacterium]|nr:VOC family protein [Chloroflexota bacterium]